MEELKRVLARLGWMIVGPLAAVVAGYSVATAGKDWTTGVDLGYGIAVAGTVGCRLWDFRLGKPLTAEGAPATPTHLRRYLGTTAAVAAACWVAMKAVAFDFFLR